MGKREIVLLLITLFVWILTFRKSFWGLLFFLIFSIMSLQRIYFNLEPFHLIKITSIFIFISWLYKTTERKEEIKFQHQFYLLIGLFLIMMLSRLSAGVPIFSHAYMDFYKKIFFFLLAVNILNTEERLKVTMWIVLIAYAALAFVSRYYWTKCPVGFMDRNNWALALVSVVPFTFYFTLSGRNPLTKFEGIAYLYLLCSRCLRTGSRGGFIGLAAVFSFFLLKDPFRKREFAKYLILIPVVFLLFARIEERYIDRYKTIENYEYAGTAQMRFTAWRIGLRMFNSHPIIGIGTGQFPVKFTEYATWEEMRKMGGWTNVHNAYIQILA